MSRGLYSGYTLLFFFLFFSCSKFNFFLGGDDNAEEDEEEIDCFFEQNLPEPELSDPTNLLTRVVKYGFANKHSGVFKDFKVFIL